MKKVLVLSILLCLAKFSPAQAPSDAYIQGIMSTGHIPGANAVVIKDGHWIYDRSLGLADVPGNKNVTRQTDFMMASISKTMIATSLMQLWERGLFQLDDNINNYLPFAVHNPNNPNDTITFRNLVTHTSSIQDNYTVLNNSYVNGDSPVSLDSFLRNYLVPGGIYYSASQNFYTYHAGTGYDYSNVGATLTAYLVQRLSGDDYSHYCDTAIFAKLCMDHTSYKLAGISDTNIIARPYSWNGSSYDDDGLYGYPDYPDGQLRTNITALARFMTMYMQHGTYNGTRLLDSSTVAMIMKDQYSGLHGQGIIFYEKIVSNGDTLWGHNGGDAGVSTAMYFNYKTKTGVIVFTNADAQTTNNMETIMDTLYKYGLTVTPSANDTFPACNYSTGIPYVNGMEQEIQIFPNPASDELTIRIHDNKEKIVLVVYDMNGRKIIEQEFEGDITKIATSQLRAGIYLLKLSSASGIVLSKKLQVYH